MINIIITKFQPKKLSPLFRRIVITKALLLLPSPRKTTCNISSPCLLTWQKLRQPSNRSLLALSKELTKSSKTRQNSRRIDLLPQILSTNSPNASCFTSLRDLFRSTRSVSWGRNFKYMKMVCLSVGLAPIKHSNCRPLKVCLGLYLRVKTAFLKWKSQPKNPKLRKIAMRGITPISRSIVHLSPKSRPTRPSYLNGTSALEAMLSS